MKAATSNEIKNELKELPASRLIELCLRLVRFKKDNKELITFLLFEAADMPLYIKNVKGEINESFSEMNTTNMYYIKKSLRKILRNINKYIKYAGQKQTEAELLIYFCTKIKEAGIKIKKSSALLNLYNNQIKKIDLAVKSLHEDLQYDYAPLLKNLIQ